jgi:tetratricopeptide (TPR) repeat protein
MMPSSRLSPFLAILSAVAILPPAAQARAEAGTAIDNVELRTLAGGRERLMSAKARANIFVFFRPNQDRSRDALRQMAACERDLAGKPVHWVAVVSGSEPVADVQAAVAESGIQMPVLLDEGDVLYDKLGIRLHPMVGIADAKFKLAALEPYRQIEYCDIIETRIRMLLGEADQATLDKVLNPERSSLPGQDPLKKAMRDVNMARRLYEIGQFEKSVRSAQKALEVAPVAAAYTVMGSAYARLGRCADSAKALDQALKLDPKDPNVQAARALCAGR